MSVRYKQAKSSANKEGNKLPLPLQRNADNDKNEASCAFTVITRRNLNLKWVLLIGIIAVCALR